MFLRTFQTEPAFAERKLFICEKVFAAVADSFDKPAIADSGGVGGSNGIVFNNSRALAQFANASFSDNPDIESPK